MTNNLLIMCHRTGRRKPLATARERLKTLATEIGGPRQSGRELGRWR